MQLYTLGGTRFANDNEPIEGRQLDIRSTITETDIKEFLQTLPGLEVDLTAGPDKNDAGRVFIINTKMVEAANIASFRKEDFNITPDQQALLDQVAECQTRVRQLLQHFWRTTVIEKDRRRKIATALDSALKDIDRAMLSDSLPPTSTSPAAVKAPFPGRRALYQPIIEAIKTALNRQLMIEKVQPLAHSQTKPQAIFNTAASIN